MLVYNEFRAFYPSASTPFPAVLMDFLDLVSSLSRKTGYCQAGNTSLAKMLGENLGCSYTTRRIHQLITRAKELGLLVVEGFRSTRYLLLKENFEGKFPDTETKKETVFKNKADFVFEEQEVDPETFVFEYTIDPDPVSFVEDDDVIERADGVGLSEAAHSLPEQPTIVGEPSPETVQELVQAGVWKSVASDLSKHHDKTLISGWIEWASMWGAELRNPGAWIATALRKGWRLPFRPINPEDLPARLAEGIWQASSEQERHRILSEAKRENGELCRQARKLGSFVPAWKAGLDVTVAIDHVKRTRVNLQGLCDEGPTKLITERYRG